MSEHGSVQAEEPSGFMDLNPAKIPEAAGRELRVSDDMLNVSRLCRGRCASSKLDPRKSNVPIGRHCAALGDARA